MFLHYFRTTLPGGIYMQQERKAESQLVVIDTGSNIIVTDTWFDVCSLHQRVD
jgi:hypothetical protein